LRLVIGETVSKPYLAVTRSFYPACRLPQRTVITSFHQEMIAVAFTGSFPF
jgi:hypothetical protein